MRYSALMLVKWPRWPGRNPQNEIEIPAIKLPKELGTDDGEKDENYDFLPVPPESRDSDRESNLDFIRARGFLKHVKPYESPDDVEQKIANIFQECVMNNSKIDYAAKSFAVIETDWKKMSLANDANLKFQILARTEKLFGKTIPNSHLHEMQTMQDIVEYYKINISVVAEYNRMARTRQNLPQNLHMIEECVRYDPERDGETAFPKQDVKLFNPRFKKMYKELKAKKEWHEFENQHAEYGTPSGAPWDSKTASAMDRIGDWRSSIKKKFAF